MPEAPTPKHGIPLPADDEFINDWPAIMRDALGDVDALMAVAIEDDPRPAAGIFGRFHRAVDGTISFDTGLAWVVIAQAAVADLGAVPIGGIVAYAGSVLPAGGSYAWADGSLIGRLDADGNPTTFFDRVGHAYNGGIDPGSNRVRLPDKRGRVPVGADNFGVGAAGRLPNSNRARGQNGGEERHVLAAGESGVNGNGSTVSGGAHSHWLQLTNDYTYQPGNTQPRGVEAPLVSWFATTAVLQDGAHAHAFTARSADAAHNNLQPYECDNYIVRIA